MSGTAKQSIADWVRIILPLLVTVTLAWIAHVKAVSSLETRQDLTEKRLNERIGENSLRLERMDTLGSGPARLHDEKLRYLTERVEKTEQQQAATAAAISDMRSDIRIIAEWVKDQRGAGRSATDAFGKTK